MQLSMYYIGDVVCRISLYSVAIKKKKKSLNMKGDGGRLTKFKDSELCVVKVCSKELQ